ncbi:MAG: hypothetical protein RSE98_00250 [Anaerovoracaceae bacterium]
MFIILTKYIHNIRNIELIRYKNRHKQIRRMVQYFLWWLVTYFALKIGVILLIGIKTFGLSTYSVNVDLSGYDELLIVYNEYIGTFNNVATALLAIIVYFIFGFTFLLSILGYINNKYGYKKVMTISLLIYMLTIIGFKTELKSVIPFICFNNYILLHHGLFVNGMVKFIVLLVVAGLSMMFCLGFKIEIKTTYISNFIITGKEKLLTISLIVLLISVEILGGCTNQDFSIRDIMLTLMFGSNGSGTGFFPWLKLTIIYLIPLFFIGISDQRMKKYSQLPTQIRFKNAKTFECTVLTKDLQYLLLYALIFWGLGCVTYYMGEQSPTNAEFMIENFGTEFTINIWNVFIFVFIINLLSDFIIFKFLSKLLSEVPTMIIVFLAKFAFYLLPAINVLNLNSGIVNLYENLQRGHAIDIKLSVLIIITAMYVSVILIRRFQYVNHTD